MKVLKSRIYEKQQDEKGAEMEQFYGEKGEMGWGNQIRSYVFQPYQMERTYGPWSGNLRVQAVMDGELDRFVNGWLRADAPVKEVRIFKSRTEGCSNESSFDGSRRKTVKRILFLQVRL